jgi:CubicO group peptidase (beta-lactamase class C family)
VKPKLAEPLKSELSGIARRHVEDGDVPGLVVVVATLDDEYVESRGTLTVGEDRPVRRESQFRISSVTKPITAAAVLTLVDEGLLALDQSIDTLLPELAHPRVLRRPDGPLDDTVAADRAITVRDLLTYTYGFGMVFDMFTAQEPWPVVDATNRLGLGTLGPPDPAHTVAPEAWLAGLGSLPLLAQPGEQWLYQTSGSVLGMLAARATGLSFPEVLRTRLFEPLGMRDTAFFATDPSRLATAYGSGPEGVVVTDEPDGAWSRPPAFPDGGAGLVSTADDLLAFSRMLLRGGSPVLHPRTVAEMTSPQLTEAQQASPAVGQFIGAGTWGLGVAVYPDGSFGWSGGLGQNWRVDPSRGLVVITLTQRAFDGPQPLPAVHAEILDAAYAAAA